jgi:large subunit ribosomal protein L17
MVTSLFEKERIRTTSAKAKEARRVAERMITFAKRGDLSARRHVAKTVKDPEVLKKLFDDIGPRYEGRDGGYTRILRLGTRRGDAAETSILELVGEKDKPRGKKKTSRKTYHKVDIPESPLIAARKAKVEAEKKAAAEAKKAAKEAEKAEKAAAEEAAKEAEAPEEEKAAEQAEPGKKKPAKKKTAEKADKDKKEEKKKN